MDNDVALVTGLGLMVLSLPSIIAAWSDRRAPRTGVVALLAGAGLVLWAALRRPGGFRLTEMPEVLYGVIARLL
ncbi:hypothetical protein [Ponticoccus sp. (in: a-proteobacteria)]|uniref:hypothetical protein n=1 Tax=Ponticoccus sp. (in: a-proteobacteria) TaxID=1925025 RepID=UPI003AB1F0B3